MAVNQVSLFFYPPRWKRYVEPKRSPAQDARVLSAAPSLEPDALPVEVHEVRAWLEKRGFAASELADTFRHGTVESIFGLEKEIEVDIGDERGELAYLYLRFTLARSSPPPIREWADFVDELSRQFRLKLGNEPDATCDARRFIAAVRSHPNYELFSESWGQTEE